MNTPLAAGVFGTVVAGIICIAGSVYLHSMAGEWGFPKLAIVCLSVLAVVFAVARWMDKRDEARRARGRSDRT